MSRADDPERVRFGAAGGEKNLVAGGAERFGDLLASVGDRELGRLAHAVRRRGIAIRLGHHLERRRSYPRIGPRRGTVIEIDYLSQHVWRLHPLSILSNAVPVL